MTKSFLTYTAIIEGLTGIALMAIPAKAALLLLQADLTGPLETILAMVAGAAIFSIALLSLLTRVQLVASVALKVLLFYNLAVSLILFYGTLALGFKGIALWGVIIFHLYQTAMCMILIKKEKENPGKD